MSNLHKRKRDNIGDININQPKTKRIKISVDSVSNIKNDIMMIILKNKQYSEHLVQYFPTYSITYFANLFKTDSYLEFLDKFFVFDDNSSLVELLKARFSPQRLRVNNHPVHVKDDRFDH